MNDAPSEFKVSIALSAWRAARELLLRDDPALEHDEAMLIELLGPEEGEVLDVLERTARAAKHAEGVAAAAKARADEIAERAQRYTERARRMRAAAFAIMESTGLRRHEMPDMLLSIRAGQQSVVVEDETKIPEKYIRIERKVDKATILSALKSGLTVDGCVLSNGTPSLSLRVK